MSTSRRSIGRAVIAAIVVVLGCGRAAVAGPIATIEYLETSLGGGLFQYDYLVYNLTDPAEVGTDLYDLFLAFSPAVSLNNATTPANWDALGGAGFVDLFSLLAGVGPTGADIGPGQSLGGFSLVFDGQIGNSGFQAQFTNVADPDNPVVIEGVTVPMAASASVPDSASSLLLLGMGMGSLLGLVRKIRGRVG